MRVGIIQSAYLPWRGYFDFIDDVDLFLLFDDVQYVKRSWRTRNKIKTAYGDRWLSVPVQKPHPETAICDVLVDDSVDWRRRHLNQIHDAYSDAPHFREYYQDLEEILSRCHSHLSALNEDLIRWLMSCLKITTPIETTVGLGAKGAKTARLLSVIEKVGAKCYLSGPVAQGYLDTDEFQRKGVALEYKTYDYRPYPQLGGSFSPHVTVLDLLFNVGIEASDFLKSKSPNIVLSS